jgi:predicted glycogen debranching enzyme
MAAETPAKTKTAKKPALKAEAKKNALKKTPSKKAASANGGLVFGPDVCGDIDKALPLEWLEANGLGGYSSGSVAGANTRRYHGLLVASLKPPVSRFVLLSSLHEWVETPEGRVELSCSLFSPDVVHPEGHLLIESFSPRPFPTWIYRVGEYFLRKTIMAQRGANAVWASYRWLDGKMKQAKAAPAGFKLKARPMFAFRGHHQLTKSNAACDMAVSGSGDGSLRISPYFGLPAMTMTIGGGEFEPRADWHYNFEYPREKERGLDCAEDLFTPGEFAAPEGAAAWTLLFSVEGEEPDAAGGTDAAFEREAEAETARRAALLEKVPTDNETTRRLALAADSFIVRRPPGWTILAGYHWFTDWGRDTMISLPGLAIATGRLDVAREILTTYARHVSGGLIPNTFPDEGGKPAYNTVDAPLWFILAADAYAAASRDLSALAELWHPLESIVENFTRGTMNRIYMDRDGLVSAGSEYTQLTWMDAKVGDWVVTPRHGKTVEINALWHEALRAMARMAGLLDKSPAKFVDAAELTRREFNVKFWNPAKGCLYDVVRNGETDAAVRPNQIFALSLGEGGLLDVERAESVLKTVEEQLLTPYGLRSLAREKGFCYHGRYEGGVLERDGAYHRGTAWAWLMGPYISAVWNTRGRNAATARYAEQTLKALEEHLDEAGLGSVSEIFDGDEPHEPRGCVSQAWSVAELLRVKLELEGLKKGLK